MAAGFWGGGGTGGRFGRNPADNPNWGGTARSKQAPPQQGPQSVVKPAVYSPPDQGFGQPTGAAPATTGKEDDKLMSLMKMLQMLMARRGMGGMGDAFGGGLGQSAFSPAAMMSRLVGGSKGSIDLTSTAGETPVS